MRTPLALLVRSRSNQCRVQLLRRALVGCTHPVPVARSAAVVHTVEHTHQPSTHPPRCGTRNSRKGHTPHPPHLRQELLTRLLTRTAYRPLYIASTRARMSSAASSEASSGTGAASSAASAEASLPLASASTNTNVHMSLEDFRAEAHKMVDFMVDYQQNLQKSQYPVRAQVQPGFLAPQLPSAAPEDPEDWDSIMSDLRTKVIPGVTHWQHPSFFAYYPANSSGPGMLGEMLSALFNTIGFSWVCSPSLTELETITLDWLARALKLPASFLSSGKGGGVIQSTASESVLVALLAARAKAWARYKAEAEAEAETETEQKEKKGKGEEGASFHEFSSKLRAYVSDQAHTSVIKAFQVAGIPLSQCHTIKTHAQALYAFPASRLAELVEADKAQGLIPFFACGTIGTTTSAAMDPVHALGRITSANDIWLHIDAAYAGSALICPEFRPLLNGVELADSFNFNAHKWLLTNFDCSPMFVKDRSHLLDALGHTAEYLRNRQTEAGLVHDYKDWQVPLGRRFRALKLWFVLRSYGLKKLREHIRAHVQFASHFSALLLKDQRFTLVVPQSLSLVCFRLTDQALQPLLTQKQKEKEKEVEEVKQKEAGAGAGGAGGATDDKDKLANQLHLQLLESINNTGEIFMVHSALDGRVFLRFVSGAPATRLQHVESAVQIIRKQTDALLAGQL